MLDADVATRRSTVLIERNHIYLRVTAAHGLRRAVGRSVIHHDDFGVLREHAEMAEGREQLSEPVPGNDDHRHPELGGPHERLSAAMT